LTVARMSERQMGQLRSACEHAAQQTRWPQGRNTVSMWRSIQTRQICSSFRRRFSASSSSSVHRITVVCCRIRYTVQNIACHAV